jgi:hypothetical protein
VSVAKHRLKEPRFSNTELTVQALAKRRANAQLLCVPWRRFYRAYEEYPRWQAFALWSRSVMAAEGRPSSELLKALRVRCPGFVDDVASPRDPELLAFQLLEWVHNQRFGYAKRQGWLDALTFYGVRHPRSRVVWEYWEHCESEWNKKMPTSVPTFDKWWRATLRWDICDKTSSLEAARVVNSYLDWEALGFWLRPLFRTGLVLPRHVTSEIECKFPSISKFEGSSSGENRQARSIMLRRVMKWGKDDCLSRANEAGWLDLLLEQVRLHPWHVRMQAYAKHFARERTRTPALPYPSFHQWERAAERFVKADSSLVPHKTLRR